MGAMKTHAYLLIAFCAAASLRCGGTPTTTSRDLAQAAGDGAAANPDLAVTPTPDGGGGDGGGGFQYPNGEPMAGTLYFRATCVSGNCEYPPYDKWLTGTLAQCSFDGIKLSLRTSAIAMGADSFSLRFEVGPTPHTVLEGKGSSVDWSLPDGASSFGWVDGTLQSAGTVDMDRCGAEVAGRFELKNLCEHHGCSSPEPWVANIVGAFRCSPNLPAACGK